MNKFTNFRVEFHILQSFPVSCLNRDDAGLPKTAIVGGVERARVSSQCWKRAVRLELRNQGVVIAERTKLVAQKIAEACRVLGAPADQAEICGTAIAKLLNSGKEKKDNPSKGKKDKEKKNDKKTAEAVEEAADEQAAEEQKDGKKDVLLFISNAEAQAIAAACVKEENGVTTARVPVDTKVDELFDGRNTPLDGLDIALFGRMVASVPELNMEAAASFAHAISTHEASFEMDFFTAVDDRAGSTKHLDSLGFNSATYYRYISLDLGQLAENLHTEEIGEAVRAFVKALFIAYPAARQSTMTAMCPWNYAIVTLRKGQGIQLPFNAPVRPKTGEDMVTASIDALNERFDKVVRMYGSLFGLKSQFRIGTEEGSIDTLLADLDGQIRTI